MIVNANPSREDYNETQHVLKNATLAQDIKVIQDEQRIVRYGMGSLEEAGVDCLLIDLVFAG